MALDREAGNLSLSTYHKILVMNPRLAQLCKGFFGCQAKHIMINNVLVNLVQILVKNCH